MCCLNRQTSKKMLSSCADQADLDDVERAFLKAAVFLLHHHHYNHRPALPMDSPVLNQLFRQLFRHPACQSLRPSPSATSSSISGCRAAAGVRLSGPSRQQCRLFLTRRTPGKRKSPGDNLIWNRRGDYPKDIDEELRSYPLVTAKDLRTRRERPRQVKMLTREFIDGRDQAHGLGCVQC